MRKMLKAALTAAIACMSAMIVSICVFAETEDVELTVENAKATNGAWGQSICYYREQPVDVEDDVDIFDCGRITPDTVVYVEFELDGEWTEDRTPVELILQNYTSADPQIWAKVEPFEWDETSASFDYQSMVDKYGSDDLSTVDNLWLGDAGVVMTVTKFTLTNCTSAEAVTTTAAETEAATEAETTEAETTAAAETEATTSAAAETDNSGGGIPLIFIIIGVAVVAVVIIVIVVITIVKKNQNRFY